MNYSTKSAKILQNSYSDSSSSPNLSEIDKSAISPKNLMLL